MPHTDERKHHPDRPTYEVSAPATKTAASIENRLGTLIRNSIGTTGALRTEGKLARGETLDMFLPAKTGLSPACPKVAGDHITPSSEAAIMGVSQFTECAALTEGRTRIVERDGFMKTGIKTVAAGVVAAVILGASVMPASAGGWRGWPAVGVGVAAGELLGAAIAQPYNGYYGGYYGYGYRGYYNDYYQYPPRVYSYPYVPAYYAPVYSYGCCYRPASYSYSRAGYYRSYPRVYSRSYRWRRHHGW